MDFEETTFNPIFVVKKSAWYQCARCLADLRTSEHLPDCPLTPMQRLGAIKHVQMVIKSFHNTKGIELLKGGKI